MYCDIEKKTVKITAAEKSKLAKAANVCAGISRMLEGDKTTAALSKSLMSTAEKYRPPPPPADAETSEEDTTPLFPPDAKKPNAET